MVERIKWRLIYGFKRIEEREKIKLARNILIKCIEVFKNYKYI
jgi:hypothetical protein